MTFARLFRRTDLSKIVYDGTAGGVIARRDFIRKTLKVAYQQELRVVLYFFGDECLLVTATTLIAESGPPVSLSLSSPNEEIGRAIHQKLMECCVVPFETLTGRKLSEWPCYVASGAKTIREFEEKSIRISVNTINCAIRLEAQPTHTLRKLFVGASHSIGAPPEELGESVKNVIEVVRHLRASDAI